MCTKMWLVDQINTADLNSAYFIIFDFIVFLHARLVLQIKNFHDHSSFY